MIEADTHHRLTLDGEAELHLLAFSTGAADRPALAGFFTGMRKALDDAGIVAVQQKIYGDPAALPMLCAAWRDAMHGGESEDLPPTWIGEAGFETGPLVGVQLVGATGASVRNLDPPEGLAARLVETERVRALFLGNVRGLSAGVQSAETTATMQIERCFEGALAFAEASGFAPTDLARTWIYLDPLLEHYDDLNRIRNGIFERVGLRGGPGGHPPPASTGIQARHPEGDACFLDLAFFAPRGRGEHPVHMMGASEQCEAWDYGSAFSRASLVHLEHQTLVYLSGTASIDAEGNTLHLDQVSAQIRETHAVALAVLERAGASFDDVVAGALFCKNDEVHRSWRSLVDRGELPALPVTVVRADICRDDLLVELELTALIPRSP